LSQENGMIEWEKSVEEKFQKVLEDIPHMIRGIAEARVTRKAQSIAGEDKRWTINEKDMVAAFFAETPGGFIPVMKNSLDQLGIDYKKYGYV
jgi:histone H3/H4